MGRSGAIGSVVRGLYLCLASGKQELQKGADALGPGGFVVLGAFNAFVVQVALGSPTLFEQDIAEALDVFDGAAAFTGAGVEPDAGVRCDAGRGCKTKDDAFVPPDRGRKSGDTSKDLRHFQSEVQGHEGAKRGAANASALHAVRDAIVPLHEGSHFFEKKFGVAVGAAAAKFGRACGRVLAEALLAGVIDTNDDERLDAIFV